MPVHTVTSYCGYSTVCHKGGIDRKGATKVLLGQMPVFTSDNVVLCKPSGLKSLDFFDTLDPPQKNPGKRPLQAGELAVPPRVRGNHAINKIPIYLSRSIPARAGNASSGIIVIPIQWSIPARAGNRELKFHVCFSLGSIPARAGEPMLHNATLNLYQVYPPRVRGNHYIYG